MASDVHSTACCSAISLSTPPSGSPATPSIGTTHCWGLLWQDITVVLGRLPGRSCAQGCLHTAAAEDRCAGSTCSSDCSSACAQAQAFLTSCGCWGRLCYCCCQETQDDWRHAATGAQIP